MNREQPQYEVLPSVTSRVSEPSSKSSYHSDYQSSLENEIAHFESGTIEESVISGDAPFRKTPKKKPRLKMKPPKPIRIRRSKEQEQDRPREEPDR